MVLALFLFRCTVFGAATLEPGASETYCSLVTGHWRAPEPSECLIRLCNAWWKLQQLKFGGAKGALELFNSFAAVSCVAFLYK